jgi:DNA-binding CsgD family transcriptional regulator
MKRRGTSRVETPGVAPGGVALKPADVRSLLRLANDLHDTPADPGARKKRLLEGLCRLLRADAGVCAVTHTAAPARASDVVTVVRWGMSEADADTFAARVPPAAGRTHPAVSADAKGSRAGADHCLESDLPVAGGRLRACVTLLRRPPDRRPFSPRERLMLELLHSESQWLYRTDLPLATPAGRSLTPRQRQTLQFLLAGHGEKQIAAQMRLSPNTVHHYVKAIHRHFRVSSRSELLARWVRK